MSVDILCEGNLISSMKMNGVNHCVLFMEEICNILKQWKKDKRSHINIKSEVNGGCRHKMRFHRLIQDIPSTDDRINPEKSREAHLPPSV